MDEGKERKTSFFLKLKKITSSANSLHDATKLGKSTSSLATARDLHASNQSLTTKLSISEKEPNYPEKSPDSIPEVKIPHRLNAQQRERSGTLVSETRPSAISRNVTNEDQRHLIKKEMSGEELLKSLRSAASSKEKSLLKVDVIHSRTSSSNRTRGNTLSGSTPKHKIELSNHQKPLSGFDLSRLSVNSTPSGATSPTDHLTKTYSRRGSLATNKKPKSAFELLNSAESEKIQCFTRSSSGLCHLETDWDDQGDCILFRV